MSAEEWIAAIEQDAYELLAQRNIEEHREYLRKRYWPNSSDPVADKLAKGAKEVGSGCVEWQLSGDAKGYGFTCWHGRAHRAHRASYAIAGGLTKEDIHGAIIRHKCDNPYCINPEHLEIGTHIDNVRDRTERGRHVCLRGEDHWAAKLTWDDVRAIRRDYIPWSRACGGGALGRKYGVNPTLINAIANGDLWKEPVEDASFEALAARNDALENEKARLAEQLERAEAELAEAKKQLAMMRCA